MPPRKLSAGNRRYRLLLSERSLVASMTASFFSIRHTLRVYALHDPHPESGFKALFAKIWYEGASAPRHVWQSTGATDDFESSCRLCR